MNIKAGGRGSLGYHDKRKALLDLWLENEKKTHTFPQKTRTVRIRVAKTQKTKDGNYKPGVWRMTERGDAAYDYRVIHRNQIVFDIGDFADMESKADWLRIKRDTELIWSVLNDFLSDPGCADLPRIKNGEYWGSLSAGKGTHTECFLDVYRAEFVKLKRGPIEVVEQDLRWDFAMLVIAEANNRLPLDEQIEAMLGGEEVDYGVAADRRLVAPKGDQLVREFGSTKNPTSSWKKTLWTVGPGSFKPLPDTREEAYTSAPLRFPTAIKPSVQPPGAFNALVREACGGMCPRGPECLPGPNDQRGYDGLCDRCPAAF